MEFLERYKCTLTVQSPVFIGSGESLIKKQYCICRSRAYIPDELKLEQKLQFMHFLDRYETFLMDSRPGQDLYKFFSNDLKLREADWMPCMRYSLNAADVQGKAVEIKLCMKDGSTGLPYIPGSSIKGAIRTALAAQLISESNTDHSDREAKEIEQMVLSTLLLNGKLSDGVNDLMRAIRISDSEPIEFDRLALCPKIDRRWDGEEHTINIVRECIIPGTKVQFYLTVDRGILSKAGLTLEKVLSALKHFDDTNRENFDRYFKAYAEDAKLKPVQYPLVIGGGAGYQSKTFTYAAQPDAVGYVSKLLIKNFRKGKHEWDQGLGVSPHCRKMTEYNGTMYPYGRCALDLSKEEY